MINFKLLLHRYSARQVLLILLLPSVFGNSEECPDKCICNSEPSSHKALICSQIPQDHLFVYENLTLNNVNPITEFEPYSVFPLVNLQNLVMDNVGLMSIKFDSKMPPVEHLRTLSLNNNKLLRLTANDFAWCINIKELRLANNSIKEIHHDAFVALQFLEILDLANNNLQVMDFMLMDSLIAFDLSNNEITNIASIGMELTNLRNLRLCGNQLEEVSQLRNIGARGLRSLCLGDSISSFDIHVFSAMPDIKELELVGKGLLSDNFSATGRILRHLQILTLSFFQIDRLTKDSLAFFDELLELHLKNIKATRQSIDYDTFCKLTKLKLLELKGSSELAATFLETDNLQLPLSVDVVSLRETKLSTIRSVSVLRNLTEVDLSQNPLLCDENLQELLNLILNGTLSLLNPNETRCANPENVRGKKILEDLVVASVFHNQDNILSQNYMKTSSNQTNQSEIEKLLENLGVSIECLFYIAAALSISTVTLFVVVVIVICVCLCDRKKFANNKQNMEGFVRADNEYTFDNFTLTETLAECHHMNYSLTDSPRQERHIVKQP